MKFLKSILIFVVVFLLLFVITLWILTKTISPDWIKSYLSTQLTRITGQPSQINGDINWQILPSPGIKVTEISVGDDLESSKLNLFIDNILFNLKSSSIFYGNLEFSEIKVDGVKASLNLDATPPALQKKQEKLPAITKEPNGSKSKESVQFAIDDFLLTGGTIEIKRQKTSVVFNDLQVRLSNFNARNSSFPIQFKFKAELMNPPGAKANVSYKGTVQLNDIALFQSPQFFNQMATNGQLIIKDLNYDQFKVSKIEANTEIKDATLFLNPLTVSLYKGESIGMLRYDNHSQSFSMKQTANGINTTNLLSDLFNQSPLQGILGFTVHMSGDFKDVNWLNSLRAKGNVTVKNGALFFINVETLSLELINEIETLLNSEKINIRSLLSRIETYKIPQGTTPFELLSIQYDLQQDGRVNNSLILQTKKTQLTGNGQINLNNDAIQSDLLLKVLPSSLRIKKAQELFKDGFPLKLRGSLQKPVIYPDVKKISNIVSKNLFKKTFDKPVKQLKDQIKGFLKQ